MNEEEEILNGIMTDSLDFDEREDFVSFIKSKEMEIRIAKMKKDIATYKYVYNRIDPDTVYRSKSNGNLYMPNYSISVCTPITYGVILDGIEIIPFAGSAEGLAFVTVRCIKLKKDRTETKNNEFIDIEDLEIIPQPYDFEQEPTTKTID